MLSWSRYGLKHRFVGSLLYRLAYKSMATTFALFYEAGKGNRYSYVYAGDLNKMLSLTMICCMSRKIN